MNLPYRYRPGATSSRTLLIIGAVLVAVGVINVATRYIPDVGAAVLGIALGVAFAAIYIPSKRYGFAVASGILIGLNIGLLVEDPGYPVNTVNIGLGLGFLFIYFFPKLLKRRSHWWPLIPGAALLGAGLFEDLEVEAFVEANWPFILLVLGIVFMAISLASKKKI